MNASRNKKAEPAEQDELQDAQAAEEAGTRAEKEVKDQPGAAVSEQPPPPEPEEEALAARLLRLQADFDNFRKRTQREKAQWAEEANESFMQELIPVLDHFEIGLETAEKAAAEASILEGFRLVQQQLVSMLKRFGLQPVEAEGQVFDPHLHEAATFMPSAHHPEDTVITQVRKGYQLGGKLLRPAQVVVSSGAPEQGAQGGGDA